MELIEVIQAGLELHGFDGLANDENPCGCEIGNLNPGDCVCQDCSAAYKSTHSATGEWVLSVNKNLTNEQIQKVIDNA